LKKLAHLLKLSNLSIAKQPSVMFTGAGLAGFARWPFCRFWFAA
jgi:hypothetical protein